MWASVLMLLRESKVYYYVWFDLQLSGTIRPVVLYSTCVYITSTNTCHHLSYIVYVI